jgi:hypothetical protein
MKLLADAHISRAMVNYLAAPIDRAIGKTH